MSFWWMAARHPCRRFRRVEWAGRPHAFRLPASARLNSAPIRGTDPAGEAGTSGNDLARLYLDTMERILVGEIYEDPAEDPWHAKRFDPGNRSLGRDWPLRAHTMIGMRRLHNLRELGEQVLERGVPGDFIETGVWRGGACIM